MLRCEGKCVPPWGPAPSGLAGLCSVAVATRRRGLLAAGGGRYSVGTVGAEVPEGYLAFCCEDCEQREHCFC